MKVRIYQTEASSSLPLMVFLHGGGFYCGNLETEDYQCRYFAAKTPCIVMSIDYPLSPPSLIDPIITAGLRAVSWCQNHASKYNADANQTILCGGSAGAWFSAMLGYHYVQEKQLDTIAGCILLYAATANATYNGKYKDKYTAWAEHGNNKVPIISTELAARMWPPQGFDFASPRHFPLLAADLPGDQLKGFPPTYFLAAEKDCIRDDGFCFEMALKDVGVKTKLDFYPGLPHWFHVFPQLEVAHEAMAKAVEGVRFVLGSD